MANRDLICLCPSRKSTIKINADLTSITLPPTIERLVAIMIMYFINYSIFIFFNLYYLTFYNFFSKTLWTLSDELAVELSLIPSRTRRRGLVNRGMWENLRSNLLQGVLKKGIIISIYRVI